MLIQILGHAGAPSVIQFVPKVFNGIKVSALFRPLNFFWLLVTNVKALAKQFCEDQHVGVMVMGTQTFCHIMYIIMV